MRSQGRDSAEKSTTKDAAERLASHIKSHAPAIFSIETPGKCRRDWILVRHLKENEMYYWEGSLKISPAEGYYFFSASKRRWVSKRKADLLWELAKAMNEPGGLVRKIPQSGSGLQTNPKDCPSILSD